jgi:hypothetical protein
MKPRRHPLGSQECCPFWSTPTTQTELGKFCFPSFKQRTFLMTERLAEVATHTNKQEKLTLLRKNCRKKRSRIELNLYSKKQRALPSKGKQITTGPGYDVQKIFFQLC